MKDVPHTVWRKSSHSTQEGGQCVELASLVHEVTAWRKSSHSGGEGGQCVEITSLGAIIGVRDSVDPGGPIIRMRQTGLAKLIHEIKSTDAAWRTSSHSSQEGGTCVELADLKTAVAVRDSTDPNGPALRIGRDALAGLFDRIKTGELDR